MTITNYKLKLNNQRKEQNSPKNLTRDVWWLGSSRSRHCVVLDTHISHRKACLHLQISSMCAVWKQVSN